MVTLYLLPLIQTVPFLDERALPAAFSVLKVKVDLTVL
jgi:hypothetical protein